MKILKDQKYTCISDHMFYFTKGKVYTVVNLSTVSVYLIDNIRDKEAVNITDFDKYFELFSSSKEDVRIEEEYNDLVNEIELLVKKANDLRVKSKILLNEVFIIIDDE